MKKKFKICCPDFDLAPMTLKLNRDLDILKMYLKTENESSHSKYIKDELKKNKSQKSRSNVTNFAPVLAFTMGHIPTKLHQFLTGIFQDIVQTDRRTDSKTQQTHTKQYLLAACTQLKRKMILLVEHIAMSLYCTVTAVRDNQHVQRTVVVSQKLLGQTGQQGSHLIVSLTQN